jgi:hypothetical protein
VTVTVRDAADPALTGRYDLATIFEALHDMSQPVPVLRAIRGMLAPGGSVLVMDERVAEAFTAPPRLTTADGLDERRSEPPTGRAWYLRKYARDHPPKAQNQPPPAKEGKKNPSASPRLTEGRRSARLLDRPVW